MVCSPVPLCVNGREVLSTEINYDDLVWLYNDFIRLNGRVPTTKDCKSANNLPQQRIVNSLLKNEHITYNDFMLMFGKCKKVRTVNTNDYSLYVERFLEVCKNEGKIIKKNDLTCNKYGLPSASWFIKYCPDKNVKTYADFVSYCGFNGYGHVLSKEEVSNILLDYENKLGSPLVKSDITPENVGFSNIVLCRLFGCFENAKEEIGLLKTNRSNPLPYSYYESALKETITNYVSKTGKSYITWKDIEDGTYSQYKINHKTYMKSFTDAGVDLYSYIKSLGCQMNPSAFSFTFTFDDGERVYSNYEYYVTNYLRLKGLKYNVDYFRSVPYKKFSQCRSKANCDYYIVCGGRKIYLEVAGVITDLYGDWRTRQYPSKIENEYRNKLIEKENWFKDNSLNYLFLFSNDFDGDKYVDILSRQIQI